MIARPDPTSDDPTSEFATKSLTLAGVGLLCYLKLSAASTLSRQLPFLPNPRRIGAVLALILSLELPRRTV